MRGGFVQRSGLATPRRVGDDDGRVRRGPGDDDGRGCDREGAGGVLPRRVRSRFARRVRSRFARRVPETHAPVVMSHDSAARRALSEPLELFARSRLEHLRYLRREGRAHAACGANLRTGNRPV